MSKFNNIDEKLEKLAAKLGAMLIKDRPDYPQALRTFEERRIDWVDGNIFKAIIIQPTFESTGVNQNIWNLINIAWYDDGKSVHRLQWYRDQVKNQKFEIIEVSIDELLDESEKTLANISFGDLK